MVSPPKTDIPLPAPTHRNGSHACPASEASPFAVPLPRHESSSEEVLVQLGVCYDVGGREYNEDRYTAFSVSLSDGRRYTVAGIFDGHHRHHVAQLVADELPKAFTRSLTQHRDLKDALTATVRSLDDQTYELHKQAKLATGGTTALIHVLSSEAIYTANVGDCKGVLSVRGAPDALNTCHNPPVLEERQRFEAAGVHMYSDHIQDSDINVCRTIGDYDLGEPLKYRDALGNPAGPLTSDPEIRVHKIDREYDEFLIMATDGLWDYYTPESTVLTDARRKLRQCNNDAQQTADWLVQQALGRQRFTLHEGTPGDNVTVMVITLRKLPAIPRTSASRLNLRSSSADLVAMSAAAEHLAPPHSQSADFAKAANGSSSSDE